MTVLDVLADHLDAFDLNQLERADIFHAYDTAPEGTEITTHDLLDYVGSAGQKAWRQARQIDLRLKNNEFYVTNLMSAGPLGHGATKMQILSALARARDILSGVDQ